QKVFQSLIKIPYGNTSTYKNQAIVLGDVKAIRAVATANGLNKIAVVIPCHRIIGSDGSMVGYAGGIHRKEALLKLEGALQQTQLSLL
ncbi:MAG: methylated-DNA--[protein]-cysteine S-methyltransferase, partial [Flavobacterium sp.]